MELKIEYTDKEITPWGEMVLMKNMLDKINFSKIISSCSAIPLSCSNRGYYKPKEVIT